MAQEIQQALWNATTEAQFQAAVLETAQRLGWLAFHVPDKLQAVAARAGRYDALPDKGFPDTWLVHPERGELIVAELKTERGTTTPEQDVWIAALRRVEGSSIHAKGVWREQPEWAFPVRVFVWRPHDRDEIERVLRGDDR